jgi:hypothetical protein
VQPREWWKTKIYNNAGHTSGMKDKPASPVASNAADTEWHRMERTNIISAGSWLGETGQEPHSTIVEDKTLSRLRRLGVVMKYFQRL